MTDSAITFGEHVASEVSIAQITPTGVSFSLQVKVPGEDVQNVCMQALLKKHPNSVETRSWDQMVSDGAQILIDGLGSVCKQLQQYVGEGTVSGTNP